MEVVVVWGVVGLEVVVVVVGGGNIVVVVVFGSWEVVFGNIVAVVVCWLIDQMDHIEVVVAD